MINVDSIDQEIKFNITHRKYDVNDSYFDQIDTEEKAYFLGLLYADGCNRKTKWKAKTISISLIDSDKEIIQKLKEAIQYTGPLYNNKTGSKSKTNSCTLKVNSVYMSRALTNAGCMMNKTFNLKFPTEEQIPSCLIHHFVRRIF